MLCEHCNGPGKSWNEESKGCPPSSKCCWSRGMEIKKFQQKVKYKYIIEVLFDLVISVTSVVTDILTLFNYFYKRKWTYGILTLIPVLLPTFVFTNVYLVDESMNKRKKATSRLFTPAEETRSSSPFSNKTRETSRGGNVEVDSTLTEETDPDHRSLNEQDRCQNCLFHCPGFRKHFTETMNCCGGCMLCLCNRDHQLRRRGALAIRRSMKRMFKYGFGTFVLRFIAWAWYIKALIFGIKAYREPKRFMKIETPNHHWSYELLVRLDFLQAALENAPQCVIQMYALITQPDEDVVLGLLTLIFSFVDFIRVSVYVHWDMDKGPVIAPSGCYNTWLWKFINTSSWILIYSARSAAIALMAATASLQNGPTAIIPTGIFVAHIILFTKLLSKAEYGVAAQKVFIAVFISLFFLPELDSSVIPALIQFYYATILIENAFFILPWEGFDKEYCLSSGKYMDRKPTARPSPPPHNFSIGPLGLMDGMESMEFETTTEMLDGHYTNCLIDPTTITIAVPTLTIIGVIFRLVSSQRMVKYKHDLPSSNSDKVQTQTKLENSIANLFNKKWTQMSVNEMLTAFLRMLKKEVIILDRNLDDETENGLQVIGISNLSTRHPKRLSFLSSKLQADFLASQTFIRESFSLLTRTARSHSHDMSIGPWVEQLEEEDILQECSSDSELTIRNTVKKRPRIPRSRNVSESLDVPETDAAVVQVDLPTGTHFLEICWV